MFSGLVGEIGLVAGVEAGPDGARLRVSTTLAAEISPGDSVAVNGVCLTAADVVDGAFAADVINQTLARTTLGPLEPNDRVNLELALRADDRLGGHIVNGHVDGTGTVVSALDDGFSRRLRVELPTELRRYLVERGSVAIDGVSLTVAMTTESGFEVSLIPETLERTTLSEATEGAVVNIEVDQIARYVERLLSGSTRKGTTADNE